VWRRTRGDADHKDGIKELPLMGKDEVAGCLLDEIAARR